MIHSHNLNARRDLLQRQASRIFDRRISIVLGSELGLQCDGNLAGFTSPSLHSLVQTSLPGSYVGPVPTICIVDSYLRDGTVPGGLAAAAMVFDAIVAHELAHVVIEESDAPQPEMSRDWLEQQVAVPWDQWPAHTGNVRWIGHDAKFIRGLLHIAHRLASRGWPINLELAFHHRAYGLSAIKKYKRALGDEPQRNSWLTLASVLNEPMPSEFKKLWTADVLRSLKPVVSKGQNDDC